MDETFICYISGVLTGLSVWVIWCQMRIALTPRNGVEDRYVSPSSNLLKTGGYQPRPGPNPVPPRAPTKPH